MAMKNKEQVFAMITDFHSHILPGIDDGSKSLEMSMTMLQQMAEQGIPRVVATPHFYANQDTPEGFLTRRAEAENLLRQEMALQGNLPQLVVGAEVYYFAGMSRAEALRDLTIGDTDYILVEMPFCTWTDVMVRELEKIRQYQGLEPIIAHVDRYVSPLHQRKLPATLNDMGFLMQANSSFFQERGSYAIKLFKQGYIHLLGSDCHNLTGRAPNLNLAMDTIVQRFGDEALWQLRENEEIVFGE